MKPSIASSLKVKVFTQPHYFQSTLNALPSYQVKDRLCRSTILSVLDLPFPHGFISGNSRGTSQWVTHPGIDLAQTRLTSEFQWNPRPVSSQKASCYMDVGMYI